MKNTINPHKFITIKLLLTIIITVSNLTYAYPTINTDSLDVKKLETPSICPVPLHPIAIFSLRKMNNFKFAPDKFSITASLSNANIMAPEVETYYPTNASDIADLSKLMWYQRRITGLEHEQEILHADGLARSLNISLNFAFKEIHEININIRSLYFEKGKPPFSLLSSDAFIEFFHEDIWKDTDTFGRKVYGYNYAEFYYTDKNGKELILEPYSFKIPGIEVSYYVYPKWQRLTDLRIFNNFGVHLGANITEYNSSMDIGSSYAITKNWVTGKRSFFNWGIGVSAMYNQAIKHSNAAQVFNDNINGLVESTLEFKWDHKTKPSTFSFAVDFAIQSAYKRGYGNRTYGGLVFYGEEKFRITNHWHHTGTHFFDPIQTWTFTYNYIRPKYILTVYVQEDLLVNNLPDVQTGMSFKYYISR